MSKQFLRKATLIVRSGTRALDLSEFRMRFKVEQSDFETPNNATIRVYNLDLRNKTLADAQSEFTQVQLSAAYADSADVIFSGTIKQTRSGREMGNNTSTYLDILAADGDEGYSYGVVNVTVRDATPRKQIDALAEAMGLEVGYVPDLPFVALSRDKTLYGMANSVARQLARSLGCRWSIQNGKFTMVPLSGVIPQGPRFRLNSESGMIGVPEVTQDGVRVRSLLNPALAIYSTIEINNKDIAGGLLGGGLLRVDGRLENLPGFLPKVPRGDGLYRIMVAEHCGDTRGHDWYTDLTCLSIERSPTTPGAPVRVGG